MGCRLLLPMAGPAKLLIYCSVVKQNKLTQHPEYSIQILGGVIILLQEIESMLLLVVDFTDFFILSLAMCV